MTGSENFIIALNLVGDWTKWLVTIETFAIAILGSLFTNQNLAINRTTRIFGTIAIFCFGISICFAAMLLLTLPEIAQSAQQETSIWMTSDSFVLHTFGVNTEDLTVIKSGLFAIGVIFSALTITTVIWQKKK